MSKYYPNIIVLTQNSITIIVHVFNLYNDNQFCVFKNKNNLEEANL